MDKLIKLLTQAFSTNFLVYYKSHVAHVNVTGRNFYQDHKLLQKIYEDAQTAIDTYAELLRQCECEMPHTLGEVCDTSQIGDNLKAKSAEKYIAEIYSDTETLIELLQKLYEESEEMEQYGLSAFVSERLMAHKKYCWMMRSLLENK